MDVDMRKLRYFVALAERLNFTAAAKAEHIAQPVLSRQIRALESELGVVLFVRSTGGTELTPAGEQLLDDARPLLSSARALQRRARQAARGELRLTIAFMPGIIVTHVARLFGERHPEVAIEVLRTSTEDQVAVLHDGRADVSFVRMPINARGLKLVPLFSEPRVVAVPAWHPLAARDSVTIGELADLHLLQDPELVPEWRDIATELRDASILLRDSKRRPLASVEEKLEHVAAERGIVVLPESTAQQYTRPDVSYVPVSGIAESQVGVAYSAQVHRPELEEFIDIALESGAP
jgi:DNA-binding transcriptional LysR family regulator